MGLGLQTESTSGDYTPLVKFDARAGRMFRVDRAQDSGGNWMTDQVDITSSFAAVFDLDSVQVGWAHFVAGVAPSFAIVPLGAPLPAKPSENHKQVFKITLKLGKECGGDVRELASQAKVVIGAVDTLHNQFTAERAAHPGQLPVVRIASTMPVKSSGKGQTSTNYAPVFEIVKWVDRPADMPAPGAVVTSIAQAAPVQPALQAAAVPQMKATAQVAPLADDEF